MKQAWAIVGRRAGEGRFSSGASCPFTSVVMGDVDDSGEFGRPNIPYERLMQQRTHTSAALFRSDEGEEPWLIVCDRNR